MKKKKLRKKLKKKKPKKAQPKKQVKKSVEKTQKGSAEKLLSLLKKSDRTVKDLMSEKVLDLSKQALYDAAEELSSKGYDIRVFNAEDDKDKVFSLVKGEEGVSNTEAIPITNIDRSELTIGFVSEIRMGAKQSQISLLHLVKDFFEKENVDFAIVAGGIVVGRPTPALAPDVIQSDPDLLVPYVVKHYPVSKKFKTYIVPGKGDLSWKNKEGFDIVSAICNERDDLFKVGSGLQATFRIKGQNLLKVICPFDDNYPKGASYGPQKYADNLRDNPMPKILVIGGTGRRSRLPAYNGMFVETVPSMHTQMTRQAKRGISPRVGYTILKLKFDKKGNLLSLKALLNSLDAYVDSQDCYGVDMSLAEKLDETEKRVLDWFVKESVLSEGELSRRLGKSKDSIKKIIEKLKNCGYKIPFKKDIKRYELEAGEKEKFSSPSLKYEDMYQFRTKEAEISDTHYGSKDDAPEVVQKAYEDAAKAGVRRVYNPGDVTDGPGSTGYRGHQMDVKHVGLDDLEDYVVSKFPKVKIKVDPKKPLMVTKLTYDEHGKFQYEETFVKEGETWLQTDAIEGNHDEWIWKASGHRIVRGIAARLPEHLRYLPDQLKRHGLHGFAVVDGVYHKLVHPKSGSGYTHSYKLEKQMGAVRKRGESGGLPTVVYLGHWHLPYLLFDQRLGMIVPCFKDEDEFHTTLALIPFVGMFITEIYTDKENNRISRVVSEYRDYSSLVSKKPEKK